MGGVGRADADLPSLGPRGEGWVVVQVILGALIAACGSIDIGWPGAVSRAFTIIGVVVAAAGILLLVAGAASLGRSLTPLPMPKEQGTLRQTSVYRIVRHPIYGGVVLIALGWSLARAPLGLLPTAALAVFFDFKARREEAWLVERYPGYRAYRERVRSRFVPWLW